MRTTTNAFEFQFSWKALSCLLFALVFPTSLAQAQSTNTAAYTFSTLAGFPTIGSADGVATFARFIRPAGMAADSAGNVYVSDSQDQTIRKITAAGVVTTIAGYAGVAGSNDGTGKGARFFLPQGLAIDAAGNLYVADLGNSTVRKITPVGTNWVVTTISGLAGNKGSADGTNSTARFDNPYGLVVDPAGNVYVTEYQENTVRKIRPVGTNWVTTTIAGLAGTSNSTAGSTDGTNSVARFFQPQFIAIDSNTNLYVTDGNNYTVRKISPLGTNWVTTTFAGYAHRFGTGDGTGTNASFHFPGGIDIDASGNLYVADTGNFVIRKITPGAVVTTIAGLAGSYGSADGTGTDARFSGSQGLTIDAFGNIFVADSGNNEIRKVTSAGVVTTAAGSILAGAQGSADGIGDAARFNYPYGIAVDTNGNLYVADAHNHTIRQVNPSGVVTTMAGTGGTQGTNDGIGSFARFSQPSAVALDRFGNVFVADYGNYTIRKVSAAGVVTTVAGLPLTQGSANGTNSVARFYGPQGIAVDTNGNIFVADTYNNMIRKITLQQGTNWVVTTIAGTTSSGVTDGTNTTALFSRPQGIAIDNNGNLFVADSSSCTIRKITPSGTNWITTTIAGSPGNFGSSDGVGTNALFRFSYGVATDSSGNVYVADQVNSTIRRVVPIGTNWSVTTIGGLAGNDGSADGAGSAARFYRASGVAVDSAGNLFVADTANDTIRIGTFTAYSGVNQAALTQPLPTGRLVVTLLPPEANGQWRFPWEQSWHNSGVIVSNLAQDNYLIQFRSIPGYLTIQTNFTVSVINGATTSITNQYYPTLGDGSDGSFGTLTVNIGPNQLAGAGWRFLGENSWRAPGSTATNLLPDVYFIEFEPVSGRSKPATQSVRIFPGLPTIISANYLLAASPPAGVLLPFAVPQNNISNLNSYPFGFNGQLQSDLGYGSGVAVQANVVLTAAHLIFNDQTLSYVSQIYWYFQREIGSFEPEPQPARGWYVLSGYAAQRTNDLQSGLYGPDQSTPQSRNLDVAALYFLSPVAGGSFGGYLPSDASPNPWLSGSSLKMLVGYPVDGSMFGDASIVPGMMYQTDPQPYALSPAADPVANQRVYTAPWFMSYPGNSGGPVYVQFNGYYYPAGVYLGTLFNGAQPFASAIRAIDSDVVNLIIRAGTLGDSGTNNSGGGVITIIPSQAITAANPGYMQWQLAPAAAVGAGAGWRLQGDSSYSSATNYLRAITSTNAVVVQFKPIAGWMLPTNQAVNVLPGQITTYVAYYTPSNSTLMANLAGISITGTTGTVYRLERSSSLTHGSWVPVSTNTITTNGFNFLLPKPNTNAPTFYRAVWLP